jgi:tetratricopeptide (TPR) repeat protein
MSSRASLLSAALALAGTLAACPPVRAEPAPQAIEVQARARYDQGIVQYALGDLQGAVESWTASYALVPTPALLFNMGQAFRQLGDTRRALFAYRAYLRDAPEAANRDEVLAHVAALDTSGEVPRVTPPAPPPRAGAAVIAMPRQAHAPSRRALIAGIAGSAVAGALSLGVGVGLSVRASRAADAIEAAPAGAAWSDTYGARYDDGRRSAAAATAFYVIGGAALAGSAIIAAVGRKTLARRATEPSRPRLSAGGLRWTF